MEEYKGDKWEYKTILVSDLAEMSDHAIPVRVGKDIHVGKSEPLLVTLGNAGWEMCGAARIISNAYYYFFFKRKVVQ